MQTSIVGRLNIGANMWSKKLLQRYLTQSLPGEILATCDEPLVMFNRRLSRSLNTARTFSQEPMLLQKRSKSNPRNFRFFSESLSLTNSCSTSTSAKADAQTNSQERTGKLAPKIAEPNSALLKLLKTLAIARANRFIEKSSGFHPGQEFPGAVKAAYDQASPEDKKTFERCFTGLLPRFAKYGPTSAISADILLLFTNDVNGRVLLEKARDLVQNRQLEYMNKSYGVRFLSSVLELLDKVERKDYIELFLVDFKNLASNPQGGVNVRCESEQDESEIAAMVTLTSEEYIPHSKNNGERFLTMSDIVYRKGTGYYLANLLHHATLKQKYALLSIVLTFHDQNGGDETFGQKYLEIVLLKEIKHSLKLLLTSPLSSYEMKQVIQENAWEQKATKALSEQTKLSMPRQHTSSRGKINHRQMHRG